MKNDRKAFSVAEIDKIIKKEKNVYFIGIGGISMSSLATISKNMGLRVGGSDRTQSAITDALAADGIEVFCGHRREHAEGYTVFVYNAAIAEDNPELLYAKEIGAALIYRADYLGYLTAGYPNSVGIAGTHGKSTTTAMLAHIMKACDCDPTVLNGAVMPEFGSAYRHGSGSFLAFEACEYKDSFLSFHPSVAVVLNIELDHVDYFKNLDNIIASFCAYLAKTDGGTAVVNFDSENARLASAGFNGNLVSYGVLSEKVRVRACNIAYEEGYPSFEVYADGALYARVHLSVSGDHNISNAVAALAAAYALGLDGMTAGRSLSSFTGVARRFEYKGRLCGVGAAVYSDYAHHPTEVRATVRAAEKICKGRLFAVFQPHTYTRTKELFSDFTSAFAGCFRVVFADVYAARETDTLGISARLLAESTPDGVYTGGFDTITEYIRQTARPDDIVLVMGAGDIDKMIPALLQQ